MPMFGIDPVYLIIIVAGFAMSGLAALMVKLRFASGQKIPTETASKLLLTLGNASVQMKVNGKTVKVTPSSSSIGFMLAPSGNKSLPTSQQPRCA